MINIMAPVRLNLELTRANLNDDSELILAIGAVMIEDLPMLVEDLQTAFAKSDWETVEFMSHTIRGLASNFQAEPLMQIAEMLETEYEDLSILEIGKLVTEITLASERTIVALKDELCIR